MLGLLHLIQGLLDLFYAAWAMLLKSKSNRPVADQPQTSPAAWLPVKRQRYWPGALGGLVGTAVFNLIWLLVNKNWMPAFAEGYGSTLLFCCLPVSMMAGAVVGRVVGDEVGRHLGNSSGQPNRALLMSEWIGGAMGSLLINAGGLFMAFM